MARDLARARWVKVLTGRGNTLTRDAFAPLWSDTVGRSVPVQILMPDPCSESESWLTRREEELARTDPGLIRGMLNKQIRANTGYLARVAQQRPAIELRTFDLPNTFRVVATDRAAYLTFYGRYTHGRHSPCLYVRAPGVLYEAALDLFTAVWAGSTPTPGTGV